MHLSNMWPSSLREILIAWYNVPIGTTDMVQVDQKKEDKINWHCMKRRESTIGCAFDVCMCVRECLCLFLCIHMYSQWDCRMTVFPVRIRSHELMLLFLFEKWIKFWLDSTITRHDDWLWGLYSFSMSLHFFIFPYVLWFFLIS